MGFGRPTSPPIHHRHPGLDPGSTLPLGPVVVGGSGAAAPWTPDQVRGDDWGCCASAAVPRQPEVVTPLGAIGLLRVSVVVRLRVNEPEAVGDDVGHDGEVVLAGKYPGSDVDGGVFAQMQGFGQ